MTFRSLVRAVLPEPARRMARRTMNEALVRVARAYPSLEVKARHEFAFWQDLTAEHGCEPQPDYYRRFMLAMGGLESPEVFRGKVCVDIGCGPKGSLTWLDGIARAALGVDPLADLYMQLGIARHPMVYLMARAEALPLPTGYADVVFSMNSLDHVDDVRACCREIRRVLKPGGVFIGSLNLDEPATLTEPWTLTEAFLDQHLFHGWTAEFRQTCPRLENEEDGWGPYRYMFEPAPDDLAHGAGPRAMWCRYRVPESPAQT